VSAFTLNVETEVTYLRNGQPSSENSLKLYTPVCAGELADWNLQIQRFDDLLHFVGVPDETHSVNNKGKFQ
jgi:hypothetical protein